MRPLAALVLLCAACDGRIDDMVVPAEPPPAPTRIDGALTTGSTPARSELAPLEPGLLLGLASGALHVAGAETLYRFDRETSTFTAVPVGEVGESMRTGPVRHLARRSAGLFVVAEGGIFHDAMGRLLRSPLSQNISAVDVRALDDLGEGADEELWLTTTDGVDRVRAGVKTRVDLSMSGALLAPDLAAAVESGKGLVLSNGNLFSVDLGARTAKWEAQGVPAVNAVARGDDGTLYLATTKGLWSRTRTGVVNVYSFAAAGEEPKAVADVTTAFGEVLVAVDGQVAELTHAGAAGFGALASPKAKGIARDANGDTFVLDGPKLVKLATGRAVSFEADVKPFMVQHCTRCHTTGAEYSPVFDLASYAVVSEPAFNAKVIQRLTANGRGPMPPPDVEVLTSSDYAVVLRWVAGGMQP
ncbi:MAG: hypothetical protein JNK82_25620 [Myxococcaceae bacterium]|nr:hypothetical protein [Myxococcaceae bacterium]